MEYRICWTASTNASFRGSTDWDDASEFGDTADVISDVLSSCDPYGEPTSNTVSQGLEEALEASGFDWWVETR